MEVKSRKTLGIFAEYRKDTAGVTKLESGDITWHDKVYR